jgi:hypothetical protein
VYLTSAIEVHWQRRKMMTMQSEQFGAAADKVAQIAGSEFDIQLMNVGNIERLISILAGAVGLLLLSRRLFVYTTLALLSAYLLFRGITGRCALYTRANINTRGQEDLSSSIDNAIGGSRGVAPADRIGAGESEDGEIKRWMERERAMDPVEQASWESFPASDPPGKA